jgi:signal transduction histidine kinase
MAGASRGAGLAADRVYAATAAGAAALAVAEGPRTALLAACLVVVLVPWAMVAAGRAVPLGAFAALTVVPVALVVVQAGVASVLFLTTVAASRVASRCDRPALVVGTTVVTAAMPLLPPAVGEHDGQGAMYFAFGAVFGVLAGVLVRRATRLAGDLRVADARLAEAAAREERHRIARDVHDLVAHSLTVVVLHVGGARRVLRTDPGAAEGALADAERVCRESLDGIRGVVGLLRDDDAEPRVLSLDLEELADGYRAAGLPVDLRSTGAPSSLPLLVRVTLHRVVQEALANAARHGGPAAATRVEVAVADAGVVARITNDRPAGAGPPGPRGAGGYGLVGLRERVASLGGELTGGPGAAGDGGSAPWVVECHLPVPGVARGPAPRAASAAPVGGAS